MHFKKTITFTKEGNLNLSSGDYVIPVMTYCMRSSGSSPDGHRYTLGKLTGQMADIISSLNRGAVYKEFPPWDIQVLSWSIQNGLNYDEFSESSKRIADAVLPEFRLRLQEPAWEKIANRWDEVASKIPLPRFEELTDEALKEIGQVGEMIQEARSFRRKIWEGSGNDSNLSDLIHLPGVSPVSGSETPWSQIAPRVYARFLTEGHFQEVGQIQIRVLSQIRGPKSKSSGTAIIDISSLVADPGSHSIQPLSFTPLFGIAAVKLIGTRAPPAIIAAAIAGILAAKYPDWDSFGEAVEKFGQTANQVIQDLIRSGDVALSKEHEALEKPVRDFGIINEKSRNTSLGEKRGTREWTNEGGESQALKDFDRIPGTTQNTSQPGIKLKTLPSGERVVYRPAEKETPVTIEIQPKKSPIRNPAKVKMRYP
jgi:hypothetical protein